MVAMRTLDRKLLRDLARHRGQAIAIGAIIACGVATLVMSRSTWHSLDESQRVYYVRSHFADVFAELRRAPNMVAPRLEAIDGVRRVETRVVIDATLDIRGMVEPVNGRIYSLPEHGRSSLNRLTLRRGRYPRPGFRDEVLLNEVFAESHELGPDDTFSAVIRGHRRRLRVVGIALSPEQILQIRPGEIWPDAKRFGVLWMRRRALAAASNLEGAFNNVTFQLEHDVHPQSVIRKVDRLLDDYGCRGSYGRDDQLSYRFLKYELLGLQAMAWTSPLVFLGVAVFLVQIVLNRIIAMERESIGVLRAFGYSDFSVAWHYLKLVWVISFLGALVGVAVGIWLGARLTGVYAEFYRFPWYLYRWNPRVAAAGTLFAMAAAGAGAGQALRRAVRLRPVEAMRPPAPLIYRLSWFERRFWFRHLAPEWKLVFRQLRRAPLRSFISSCGIAAGVAILVFGFSLEDAFDFLLRQEFEVARREDVTVAFSEDQSPDVLHELRHLPGVLQVEGFRSVPIRLRHGARSYRTSLLGTARSTRLTQVVAPDGDRVPLPVRGLLVSSKLLELLGLSVSETVDIEFLDGRRRLATVPVSASVDDFNGIRVHGDLRNLERWTHEYNRYSGAWLRVDRRSQQRLYHKLKALPQVASVGIKEGMRRDFEESIVENLRPMRTANLIFSMVIAAGVLYNTARIALTERSRELASLQVLGMTRWETSRIILGELTILTAAATPLGWLLGYAFVAWLSRTFDFDLYRVPVVIERDTFLWATLAAGGAMAISMIVVHRRIRRLDMIEVLKNA